MERSEPILEVVREALNLGGVGSAASVNAGYPLRLGLSDLSGPQPDLADDEIVVGVTIIAVVASRVKEVRPAGEDEI